MPELVEVERARTTIEDGALHRTIVDVDDADTYVCRPHAPGEIRDALVGRQLTAACRRGKAMWCETSRDGPRLGLHLGMAGRIVVADAEHRQHPRKPEWDRFLITFEGGTTLRLFDKRRLGRARLDPDIDALGPDAGEVDLRGFREALGASKAPVKARLLDQSVVAGVGNLLADETLWQAHLDPRRRVVDLDDDEVRDLHKALRKATRSAVRKGGVHTGEVIAFRKSGRHCPRCGAAMTHATVGGRTTWWCPEEQQ